MSAPERVWPAHTAVVCCVGSALLFQAGDSLGMLLHWLSGMLAGCAVAGTITQLVLNGRGSDDQA